MGNTTYYYNANGSAAGSSTRMGNTTYYYGPNGAPAGSATRTGWEFRIERSRGRMRNGTDHRASARPKR